ncbi:MAG TPA: VWA domain-containing protein, partial [Pilimelia sp.]|nr:VWA domain-containing protein [Pilimelia sp.]
MTSLRITLELHQERCLSPRDDELHAILTVTARRDAAEPSATASPAADPGPPGLAEVIVIDCSGSMADPPTKIAAARRATAAALDALPDGARFAVVEGTHQARMVYPVTGELAVATPQTRAQARSAVAGVTAAGGTAFGAWLLRARDLLAAHPSAVRHALLLTDGRNEHETAAHLDEVLAQCAGRFVCDARGVGDGWQPSELMRIASALRGTADAVRAPEELTADFRRVVGAATAKILPELRLRIGTVAPARLRFCKQVHPTAADLPGPPPGPDAHVTEVSIGAWGEESRDYHLCFEVDSGGRPRWEDLRVARVDVVVDGRPRADPAVVLVHWTDDPVASSRIHPAVAHYTAQEQLGQAVVDGCDAHDRGDHAAAVRHWGEAVRLATESGNARVLERLQAMVEVVDAAAGVVRLRPNLSRVDRLLAETRSSHTVLPAQRGGAQPQRAPEVAADPGAAGQRCGRCGASAAPAHRFCMRCGGPLGDRAA